MSKFWGLVVASVVVAAQPTAAAAGVTECSTSYVSSSMSPTAIVVGVANVRSSTFTVKIANTCDNPTVTANLASVDVVVGRNVPMTMGATVDGVTTFSGTTTWDSSLLDVQSYAGEWLSYIDLSSDNGPSTDGPGVQFKVLRSAALLHKVSDQSVPQDTVVNVTGALKRASWDDQVLVPFGGQLVSLQFQPPGGVYSTVRTMRSMSNGSTFGMVRVEATGCYRMVSAETGTTASATSPRSCVVVS